MVGRSQSQKLMHVLAVVEVGEGATVGVAEMSMALVEDHFEVEVLY